MRSLSFLFTVVFFIIIIWYSLYTYEDIYDMKISESLQNEDRSVIKNIEQHPMMNRSGEKIFFVESHSNVEHKLSGRQACSIESAALMNPNDTIVVTFLTPDHHAQLNDTMLTKILMQYKNIYFMYVNIKDFSKNTPLAQWINTDELGNSKYVVSHTSDVLRYLLLYKYSGLYLDMDIITTYPSGHINLPNFACAESSKWLNGAVLKLTGNSGRKIAENLLLDVVINFDGEIWGKNGPQLLTRAIKKLCDVSEFHSTTNCRNFTILERDKCYAISWEEWEKFFQPTELDYVRRHTKKSYFVHLWNHFSDSRKLKKDSSAALNKLAEEFCPKIYKSLDTYF